jgi:hypothetical protein
MYTGKYQQTYRENTLSPSSGSKILSSSAISVDFHRTTLRYILQDRMLHNHRCEKLTSNKWLRNCYGNFKTLVGIQQYIRIAKVATEVALLGIPVYSVTGPPACYVRQLFATLTEIRTQTHQGVASIFQVASVYLFSQKIKRWCRIIPGDSQSA